MKIGEMWCNKLKRVISSVVAIGIIIITLLSVFHFPFLTQESPHAKNGELDLTLWNFTEKSTLPLDGEWEFYPNELITPAEDGNPFQAYQDKMELIDVPGSWNEYQTDPRSYDFVGTYRLLVNVPSDDVYGIKTNKIHYANQLFMNGKLVGSSGIPSKNSDEYDPNLQMYMSTAQSQQKQLEIVFHVANYTFPTGGIVNSVDFGTAKGIERLRDGDRIADGVLISGYFLLGVFYIGTFIRRKQDNYFLFFSLLCFTMSIYLSMLNERLIDLVIPNLSLIVLSNMQLSAAHVAILLFLLFIHYFFKEQSNKKIVMVISFLIGLDAIQYMFPVTKSIFPGNVTILTKQFLAIGTLSIACVYIGTILIKAFLKRKEESEYMLIVVTTLLCYIFLLIIELLFDTNIGRLPVVLFFIMMYCLTLLMGDRSQRTYEYANQLSKELLIQDQLKDEFLAKTSLQLGAPLQSISQVSQYLMEGKSGPLRMNQHENIMLIQNISTRLGNIVSDLLDASKIKQGEMNIQPTPTRVNVIKSVVDEMNVLIPSHKNVKITSKIPDDLPLVYVDGQRLKQVVFNLIHNAIYFTEDGEIAISAYVVENAIHIEVADTGIGIPAEDLNRIFSSFYQAKNELNEESTGLGLGLTISKQLVELSGGDIWVSSTLGEGTTFTFTIPVATQEQLAHAQDLMSHTGEWFQHKKDTPTLDLPVELAGTRDDTILIVDHNHEDIRELIALVHSENYHVLATDLGKSALELMDREQVDLLIIGPNLPDMSASEICRVVREMHHMVELPILVLSATGQAMALDTLLRMNANGFLLKPVHPDDLLEKIASLLAMKKSSQEALYDELSFFYAQITPHFLYNTFNTIIGLSYKDPEKAREALQHLAVYFRAKLDFFNRDTIISLKKELDLIQSYLKIEQMRYGDKLTIQCDIDENIDVKIPTLVLQPLVENAVQHGITKQKDGGTLRLSVQKVGEGVEVIIEDNGVGMTKERQEEILHEKAKGIGVMNSMKRLKLIKDTKFSLESEIGIGTKIAIFLPGVINSESSHY